MHQRHANCALFSEGARFDHELRNNSAIGGGSLFWPCRAQGAPGVVQYDWYFEKKKIMFADSLALRSTVEASDKTNQIHMTNTIKFALKLNSFD